MGPTDKDPEDIDARQRAETARLLREMTAAIERGRLLLRVRERALALSTLSVRTSPGTLGAVLYGRPSPNLVAENEWVMLLRRIAAGDAPALHSLCQRTQHLVFTLILCITSRPAIAEQLTNEVFRDISRQANRYDPAKGSVLGWIMNRARAKAVIARRDPPRDQGAGSSVGDSALALCAPPRLDPPWEPVAPGISVKLYATDTEKQMVSMLVRLAPGADYPPHTHAGVEQLHLLEGELWIDERKLYAGDYNRAEPGTGDKRVWSETGCTCLLVTSTQDILR